MDGLRFVYADIFDLGTFEDARAIDCLIPWSAYIRFIWTILLPTWLVTGIFLVPRLYRLCISPCQTKVVAGSYQEDLEIKSVAHLAKVGFYQNAMQRAVAVVILLHPLLCSTLFRLLRCRALDQDELWHQDDFSISCHSSAYKTISTAAVVLMIVYPFGVPAILFFMLFKNRLRLT